MSVTEPAADEHLSLVLCRNVAASSPAAAAPPPNPDVGRTRVALVCRTSGGFNKVAATLRLHGFTADALAPAAPEALVAGLERHDAVLLQYPLSGDDSWETLRRIRALPAPPPVIIVSDGSDSVDRVVGLELGADDYVDASCSTRELLARIRAVLRRRSASDWTPPPASPVAGNRMRPIARFGRWEADLHRRRLLHDGEFIPDLTANDHQLLTIFLHQPQQVIRRETLMEALHRHGATGRLRTIDVSISRLRHKLDRGGEELIRTVRSCGYLFLPEVHWQR